MLRNVHAAKVGGWWGGERKSIPSGPPPCRNWRGRLQKASCLVFQPSCPKTPKPHTPHPKFLPHHPKHKSWNPTSQKYWRVCCVVDSDMARKVVKVLSPCLKKWCVKSSNTVAILIFSSFLCIHSKRRTPFPCFVPVKMLNWHAGWWRESNLGGQNCDIFRRGLRQCLHFSGSPLWKYFTYCLPHAWMFLYQFAPNAC